MERRLISARPRSQKLFLMDSCNDITSRILELFSGFTPAEDASELNDMIAQPIKTLSIYRVLEIRCAITSTADLELPAVAAALNLIDGQIALREIAAGAPWR
jgi:hypothetical protein